MYEYQNFGDTIVRREVDSSTDWETCADDDIDARVAMGIKQHNMETREHNGPPIIVTKTIRSTSNISIGEKLGLGVGEEAGDKLAEALNNKEDTQTTRLSDDEFDELMSGQFTKKDGKVTPMSKEEIRARFKGTYEK